MQNIEKGVYKARMILSLIEGASAGCPEGFYMIAYRLQVEFSTTSSICVGIERRHNAASQYSDIHFDSLNAPRILSW